jgi:SAM-dependent methyltransferase
MEYIYNQKSLPRIARETLGSLDAAAARLYARLAALNPNELPLSDYGRENLADFQSKARETFKKYVHLIAWSLYPEIPGGHAALVDYGGGHGLLACLAKEAGLPRVIYNDIFSGCCDDARILARLLQCPAEQYVCGDIRTVGEQLRPLALSSVALVSINVIEHVYDMDAFVREAGMLTRGPMTLLLSTSANPLNPMVARRHFAQHRLWEFHDGPHESSYPMDTQRAFRTVRRELIQAVVPHLDAPELDSLTEATRGMWKPDIEACALEYAKTRQMPPMPAHPTNTCDPLTGSWQERLLDIPRVSQKLAEQGCDVRVLGGYYSGHAAGGSLKGGAKRVAANVLNHAISQLGERGARLAPCFMFHAARR